MNKDDTNACENEGFDEKDSKEDLEDDPNKNPTKVIVTLDKVDTGIWWVMSQVTWSNI